MAGEDILGYTGAAAVAYKDALDAANNAKNALLRQYGFTMPNASGEYTIEGAQAAFDPNTLFSRETGQLDANALQRIAGSLTAGGKGLLADITSAGASTEADVISEARSRGFGGDIGGGLMNQRRRLAETQTKGELGQARSEFLASLGQTFAPIGGAWQNLQTGMLQDQAAQEAAKAYEATLVQPEAAEEGKTSTVSTSRPTNPRQYQRWTNPTTGKKFQFVSGKWKKV